MAKNAVASTSAEAGLTRGHKKKARTRKQLIEAAMRIYARQGAAELALNQLAEEAGVSNGTVYNYFRSKEEVLDAVGIALAEALSVEVTALSRDLTAGAERIAVGVRSFVLHAIDDPQWASALVSVAHYAEGMRSLLAANVRSDLQLGSKQGDLHYENEGLAMMMVVAITTGAMQTLAEGNIPPGYDCMVAEMVLLALGLDREKARAFAFGAMPESANL